MPPVSPMLAKLCRQMPEGGGLAYEPKWDGFRCIVFRDGPELELGSRNERPLTRYFPELVASLLASLPERCVLDGEIVIAGRSGLDFDAPATADPSGRIADQAPGLRDTVVVCRLRSAGAW